MKSLTHKAKKGFTLLELLIVIAILAILTTLVVVILNPAELLAQGRDSQRFSDLNSLKSGLALYLKDKGCNTTNWSAEGTNVVPKISTAAAGRAVDGNGWVAKNLSSITGGSPLAVLPVDPRNTTTAYPDGFRYYFTAKDSTAGNDCKFELAANLESALYKTSGSDDRETNTKDGGNNADLYETGTDLTAITTPTN